MDHPALVESQNILSSSGVYPCMHVCMYLYIANSPQNLICVQSPVMIGGLMIVNTFKRSVERHGVYDS